MNLPPPPSKNKHIKPDKVERIDYIGSLDASVIVGVDSHRSTYDLWLEKTGQTKAEDLSEVWPIVKGNVLEEPILNRFEKQTGYKVQGRQDEFFVKDHPFIRCHVDGWFIDEFGQKVVVDAKAPGYFMAKKYDPKNDACPPPAMFQQYHIMLCNPEFHHGLIIVDKGSEIDWVRIERNQAGCENLLDMEIRFWDWVKTKTIPPLTEINFDEDDLKKMFPKEEDLDLVQIDPEFEDLINQRQINKAKIKELQEAVDSMDLTIKAAIADHTGLSGTTYKVTWKWQKGKTEYDLKKFQEDHPGMLDSYAKTGGYRVMRVSANKDKKED